MAVCTNWVYTCVGIGDIAIHWSSVSEYIPQYISYSLPPPPPYLEVSLRLIICLFACQFNPPCNIYQYIKLCIHSVYTMIGWSIASISDLGEYDCLMSDIILAIYLPTVPYILHT